MIVSVNITKRDIDIIRQALGRDEDDNYFDWSDPDSVGEAIETLIQEPLNAMFG